MGVLGSEHGAAGLPFMPEILDRTLSSAKRVSGVPVGNLPVPYFLRPKNNSHYLGCFQGDGNGCIH